MVKTNLEPIEEGDLDLDKKFSHPQKGESVFMEQAIGRPMEREHSQERISAEREGVYGNILSKIKENDKDGDAHAVSVGDDARDVFRKTDAESQVQHLVDLAIQKGVVHAVKVARHVEDNYVLDQLHDRMCAEDFHEALVKKGLLKED